MGTAADDTGGRAAAGDARNRLAAICLGLAESACEGDQHLRFQVRGRTFAYYLDDHHGDGMVAVCCKAPPGEAEALVATDPDRFHRPAYLGSKGWVSLRLDAPPVDWAEVAELVTESYRLVAPRRLAAGAAPPAPAP